MSTLVRSELDHQTSRTTTHSLEVRINELAGSRLRNCPYCAVRGISCEYHDGVLTLRGRLSTYYHKQIAQELVTKIDGVREIANLIEVKYPAIDPIVENAQESSSPQRSVWSPIR